MFRPLPGLGRLGLVLWSVLVLAAVPVPATAQEGATPTSGFAVLVIDQERLFAESAFGQASIQRERLASKALEAENGRIQAELIAEEQELTLLRDTLPAEEFSARATAFDQKVERIRAEQDTKARDLVQAREADVQVFFQTAAPVLEEMLADMGAGVILDRSNVILSISAVDVTDAAIARIDKVLGDSIPTTP